MQKYALIKKGGNESFLVDFSKKKMMIDEFVRKFVSLQKINHN